MNPKRKASHTEGNKGNIGETENRANTKEKERENMRGIPIQNQNG